MKTKIDPQAQIIRTVLNKINFSELVNFNIDEENEIIVDEKYEYNNLINVKHNHKITKNLFDSEEKKVLKNYKLIRKNKLNYLFEGIYK